MDAFKIDKGIKDRSKDKRQIKDSRNMARIATRDKFEDRFIGRITLVAATLDYVTIADDATLEDTFETHDSNARTSRSFSKALNL